jgi:hypothetical protein
MNLPEWILGFIGVYQHLATVCVNSLSVDLKEG